MCMFQARPTLIGIAFICVLMNSGNILIVTYNWRNIVSKHPFFRYIPDVHNITSSTSQSTSDKVQVGLATLSIPFDLMLLVGSVMDAAWLLPAPMCWGMLDMAVDVAIGLLSGNYSKPGFLRSALGENVVTVERNISKLPSDNIRRGGRKTVDELGSLEKNMSTALDESSPVYATTASSKDYTDISIHAPFLFSDPSRESPQPQMAQATPEPDDTEVEKKKVKLVYPVADDVRQVLHFTYVLLRVAAKINALNLVWHYYQFLTVRQHAAIVSRMSSVASSPLSPRADTSKSPRARSPAR